MLCTSLSSQGTGKTLWKSPKDRLVHLERSSGRIQRPDACPTYLPPSIRCASKPTGTRAPTINFHSTHAHTQKTGGLTTDMAVDPSLPAAGRRKAPSLFPPPPQNWQPWSPALPLNLHPPCSRHGLSLPLHRPAAPQGTDSLKQQKKH